MEQTELIDPLNQADNENNKKILESAKDVSVDDIKEYAQSFNKAMIDNLVVIAVSADVPIAPRVAASNTVLAYGHGKPVSMPSNTISISSSNEEDKKIEIVRIEN